MTERFEDWSPASIFGATTPEPGRQRRTGFRASYKHQLQQIDSDLLQRDGRSAVAPTPPARRVNSSVRQHEIQLASPRYNEQFGTAEPLRGGMKVAISSRTETNELNVMLDGDTVSLDDHHRLPSGRKSSRNSARALASVMQAEERNLATSVLQKYARIFLLRRREQESFEEVNALRLMLKQAAASLLGHCYRQYRSRCAINAYLNCWGHQESRIQALLQQVETDKRKREAEIASRNHQRRQEQLQARRQSVSLLISQWCAARVLLRQHHKESLRVRASECQRRTTCWYRRVKIEQRRQGRAQSAREHEAAFQIQQAYRKSCRRRAKHFQRRLAAKKTICDCIQRFLARKKSRKRRLEAQSALQIQNFYLQMKEMRDARLELVRRRRIHRGAQSLSTIIHRRKLHRAYFKWLAVYKFLQQQEQQRQNSSARLLQLTFRAAVACRKRERQHTSAIAIQRVFRGYQARQFWRQLRKQRRKLAKEKGKQRAATKIQSRVRGFLARVRFAKLMKQLRDRFRCSNCGAIEPSGVYCKLCGRKRTDFDLLMDKRALLLYAGYQNDSNSKKSPGDQHIVLHLAPVGPASPPSFPKLQASKNGKLRTQMASKGPRISSQPEQPEDLILSTRTQTSLAISALNSLPMVLSPRHAALHGSNNASIPAKRPANRPMSLLKPSVSSSSNNNQVELQHTPNRLHFAKPEPRAVGQTKLRAQTLTSLQSQQQEISQAHALMQHLRRLQKASHAISRSR